MKGHQFIVVAALMAAPAAGYGAVIDGDVADGVLQGPRDTDPTDGGTGVATQTGFTLKVGGAGGGGRAAEYVFQLPDLGAVPNPFASASLSFGVGAIDANTATTTHVNGDLYGLGRRAAPDILSGDYYLGSSPDPTDATLIQNNILAAGVTPASSTVETDATGDSALVNYLNAQYANGAGIGQYVFLRLSPDTTFSVNTGYNVYTANEPTNPNPTITYEAVPEPTALGLVGLAGVALAWRRRS